MSKQFPGYSLKKYNEGRKERKKKHSIGNKDALHKKKYIKNSVVPPLKNNIFNTGRKLDCTIRWRKKMKGFNETHEHEWDDDFSNARQ